VTPREAYQRGWRASSRPSASRDLGAAEDRFEARHGREAARFFADGWIDYASGLPKYHSLPDEYRRPGDPPRGKE